MSAVAHRARRLLTLFGHYRANLELARDPDEPAPRRNAAWTRAANQRRRIEQHLTQLMESNA